MNFKFKIILIVSIHFLTSCSSVPKSIGLGAGIGLGVGTLASRNNEDRNQANTNMLVSALVGGRLFP